MYIFHILLSSALSDEKDEEDDIALQKSLKHQKEDYVTKIEQQKNILDELKKKDIEKDKKIKELQDALIPPIVDIVNQPTIACIEINGLE